MIERLRPYAIAACAMGSGWATFGGPLWLAAALGLGAVALSAWRPRS